MTRAETVRKAALRGGVERSVRRRVIEGLECHAKDQHENLGSHEGFQGAGALNTTLGPACNSLRARHLPRMVTSNSPAPWTHMMVHLPRKGAS